MHPLRIGTPARLYTLFVVAAVAAIAPFAHVLGDLYNIWNLKPEYSHGVIIPLLSAFLIWRQREELRNLPFTGSWTGLWLIAFGLVLRFIGAATTMHTLEHYAFLLVLYGLVLSLTGPVIFKRLWMPLIILVFAVPLPSFFNNALSLHLQLISSELGVWVIRAAGISVLLEGNIIDLGNYQLEVAEACSGLRYLFPLMTLSFIVAYLFRGPMWKRATVFLSSIPVTVIMNSLRIGFIGITVEHWGSGMAEGALHDFEGWLVFMLSTGAVVLTAFGLSRIGRSKVPWSQAFAMGPVPQKGATSARASGSSVSAPKSTSALASVPASSSPSQIPAGQVVPRPFVAAAVLVMAGAAVDAATPAPTLTFPERVSFADFPTQVDDWVGRRDSLQGIYLDALHLDDYVLADFSENAGPAVNFYSAYYQTQDNTRAIHSPHDCIPGGGWEIVKFEQRMMPATQSTAAFPVNRAIVQLGNHRQIVYYWFDERGRQITNEYVARWYLFWDALTRHRTDGALVRFVATVPPGGDETEVDNRIVRLATRIEPTLNRFVPN
jgi:exosortase D (VPLPA-CTERM-specific)